MTLFKSSETKVWFLIHILIPITPFLIGIIVRLTYVPLTVSWETFNASDLAIAMGFMSLLMVPSLLTNERILDNKDKRNEIIFKAISFSLVSSFFFVSYGFISYCKMTIYEGGKSDSLGTLIIWKIIVVIFSLIVAPFAIRTQSSFKLKVNL